MNDHPPDAFERRDHEANAAASARLLARLVRHHARMLPAATILAIGNRLQRDHPAIYAEELT